MKLLSICLLALGAVALGASEYPDISYEDLTKAIEAETVTILDANGTVSYAKAHIPGAIDYEATAAKEGGLAEVLPEDKGALVVAYCGGPGCKAYVKAAKAAADLGYTNVKHFSGGITGWLEKNPPDKEAPEPTSKVTPKKTGCCGGCGS